MQKNILEYLEHTVHRVPDKIAYSDGTDSLSFAQLYAQARSIGSALHAMHCSRAPVAVLMSKHPNEIAAFYGVVYAGCFYVPLDADMPVHRIDFILETVGASHMLVDKKGSLIAERLHYRGKVLPYEALAQAPCDEAALAQIRAKQVDVDPIYVVFTSGSTGNPKGVVACHRSVIDYTEALSEALGLNENSVFANQTPLFFDAPLKELMPVIKFGATAYLVPKQLFLFPMRLCDFLNQYRINTICWVVSALTMVSSLGVLEKNPPRYLTTVAFGSEVFPLHQYRLWRKALPNATFYNLYGPTEATGMSFYWKAERELEEGEPIPVGVPFNNTDFFLLNEQGTLASTSEPGEIYLRGTCVTLGYFNEPQKTAEAFVQNPLQKAYPETVYRTGDIGYINSHGELVFVGRKDAQIKHMGHRIELGEIESAALKSEEVSRACCLYDAEHKRILLFYTGHAEEKQMLVHLAAYLPRYMLPAVCRQLETFPLTPNGKIDRRALMLL